LIRQNSNYPNDFRSQVATTDVIEDKVKMQIDKINDLIDKVEPVNDALPVLNPIISIYQDMKRTLERKLEHLYEYNIETSDNNDIEDKIKIQKDKINDLIDKVEPVNDALPVLNPIISIYQDMKRTLERKLEHLYEFNTATSDNYDLALELADNVLEGLNQVHN